MREEHRSGGPRWGTVELAGLIPSFFEAAPDAIVVVDETGTIVLANQQVEHIFGWARDALIGEEIEVLVPERFRGEHVDHRDGYMEDPGTRPMGAGLELYGLHQDGTEFPVEISLSPLETDRGLLVMAAVRDMTKRMRAEERFEELLEAAPDAMILVDTSGEITLVNEQAETLFGYERAEMVGELIELLVPERFRGDHVDHRDAYIEDPSVRPMGADLDLWGLRKDGTEFPVEISLSPFHSDDELQVIAAVRDMTDHEQVKRELRRYAQQLERSNEEWEQFAHVVSHDLQEPIRMVNSYMQLLRDRFSDALPEEAQEAIDFAEEGAQRMHELIRGLLKYSRVDTRGDPLEPVDTEAVLEETIASLTVAIEETGAEITYGDLPQVQADRAQLGQLFQNLLQNAIKFRHEDRPPRIEVTATRTNGRVRFEVEDNGIGIPKGLQDKIFVIFQRLHARGETDGQGIGLSLCKKIVERHGGKIGVDATPGEGSTVWFTLPVPGSDLTPRDSTPETEDAGPPRASTPTVSSGASEGQGSDQGED